MNPKEIITRRVWVNSDRSPQQVLDATCRSQRTDKTVVGAMPRGRGGEVEVFFCRVDRPMTDDELKIEYETQGFVPAPPLFSWGCK